MINMKVFAVAGCVLLWFGYVGCVQSALSSKTAINFAGVHASQAKQTVVVSGEYMRWSGHCAGSPPVSKSDWMLQNDKGCVYVTGKRLDVPPKTVLTVKGLVQLTTDKRPYIVANEVLKGAVN